MIKAVVMEAYNPQTRFLSLNGLIDHPGLRSAEIIPDLKHNFFSAMIFNIIKETFPEVLFPSLLAN